jgi:hypothetical protein
METQGKFTLMNLDEYRHYLTGAVVNRTITHLQNHHTWSPAYRNFDGANHFAKMRSMEESHIQRGFNEIGQHITTFPDGMIGICRSLEKIPAGIKGHNTGGVCIEHLGNFDAGKDQMTEAHRTAIIRLNALLAYKFELTPNLNTIVYHHWFQLETGRRDGGGSLIDHKTCPGTAFFGGNKEADAEAHFLPLVREALVKLKLSVDSALENSLRTGVVNAIILNVRSGPGTAYPVIAKLKDNDIVTILESNGDWDRIGDNRWVNSDYIAEQ